MSKAKSYITLKFAELKEKFASYFLQKKKVKALENFISVAPIEPHRLERMNHYLGHINHLLETEFIDEIEDRYLNDRIEQLKIDALYWCHKTKSLKEAMAQMKASRPIPAQAQIYMPWAESRTAPLPVVVPTHLIAKTPARKGARA